jgi:hypothetical protein
MRFERSIPRREAGTRRTIAEMQIMAWAGQDVPLAALMRPDGLDGTMRNIWFYLPDGKVETIRTVARMQEEFNVPLDTYVNGQFFGVKPAGMVAGDCDDAAVLAAAALLHARRVGHDVGTISIVAARPGRSTEFEHVFVMFELNHQPTRVDPTAPVDADYSTWEKMTLTF